MCRLFASPGLLLTLVSLSPAAEPAWAAPMRQAHSHFKGVPGTLALFGDSITNTLAFWAPLQWDRKGMDEATLKAYERVKARLQPECWQKWRGPTLGNESGKTSRWAVENMDTWIKKLNPEVAIILFGTNDLAGITAKEYETNLRSLVVACLKNGTVPILTTIPPRSGAVEKSRQFAEVARKLAVDFKVPLVDYQAEILKRRPDDWDGTLPKFKEFAKDAYEVPTLIAGDGVHPSNPAKFKDFTEEGLRSNGYVLRNYLTLHAVADVMREFP